MSDDDLETGITGTRQGTAVQDEAHLEPCPICGGRFDKRVLDEVLHHLQPGHAAGAAHIGRQCGGLTDKPIQRSFACPPAKAVQGVSDVLAQWAAHAAIGECLTVVVRRER